MNNIKGDNFFIPRKIAVGFVNRANTYSGKLAYVTYYDNTNKLRKETSWNSWRDENISPVYTDNIPTSGFILNKRAGGEKYGWNQRATYARIYDPRGFEFEITIDNLLWILEYVNTENKELKGKFVYSWYGTDLVLMPVVSSDYEESKRLSEQRYSKTSFKEVDLIPGTLYKMKGTELNELVYIGKVKVSTEFNKSFTNKLAFVSIHDSWNLSSSSYDDNVCNEDFFIFKGVSSIIAEMQHDYLSVDEINEYLHRFEISSYSYDFWNNFGTFIDRFVSDHPTIKSSYKEPYKISYSDYESYPTYKLKNKFEYEGINLDRLKIIPEWLNNDAKQRLYYSNTMVLKSIISYDGKSVLIKDTYPTVVNLKGYNNSNMVEYNHMYDFMKIDLNSNTFEKLCDIGIWDEHRNYYTVMDIIHKYPSDKEDIQKAKETNKFVELNDNRTLLYYITKDNYISSSLQKMIDYRRYALFGYSNGVKENKWIISNIILLPRKIK